MVKVLYQCPVCEQIYEEQAAAEECEARGQVEPQWAVGDLLVLEPEGRGRYTNFDGDPLWVWDTTPAADAGERHRLIYVVTAITYGSGLPFGGHFPVYHLATKAVLGEQHRQGYIRHGEQARFQPTKVARAGLDVADLLGQEAEDALPGA